MTEQQPQGVQPFQDKEPSRMRLILRELWRIVRNNFGFKLLALLLAVILWAGLITQDPNLTRTKDMPGTAVKITGEDNLRRAGYIVVEGTETLNTGVTVRADVPQLQYQTAAGSNYNPTLNLSGLSGEGLHEVRITTNNSTTYGNVLEVVPATVRLKLEAYVANSQKPVRIAAEGEVPEGWVITAVRTDERRMEVSGPASVVNRIRYVEAIVPLDSIALQEGDQEMAVLFRLMDGENEVISDQVTVTYGQVQRSNLIVTLSVASVAIEESAEEAPAATAEAE
ncbi:MAG: hypothetical protein IJK28_01990 [Clostridia bacterium]|nr:hypothetical protein [Clostridia bacterium]